MVSEYNTSWRLLSLEFNKGIKSALIHQHHAVQLIALAGKYLIPEQDDDSHTSMQYSVLWEWIFGNELPGGFRIALHLPTLRIIIINQSKIPYTEFALSCSTKTDAFFLLRQKLEGLGVDVGGLKNELHYKIPGHELDGKAAFLLDQDQDIRETILYRHNAEIILNRQAAKFENAEPVRIWPHHFDTGTIIPLESNADGTLKKSIGLGWAIPDTMVDEPYFYLSYRSKESLPDFSDLTEPANGEWSRDGWNGGVLKNSELLSAKDSTEQEKMVADFFESGIQILSGRFNF
jgi:hypothetical protein